MKKLIPLLAIVVSSTAGAQTFTNGDFTGPLGAGVVPPGWTLSGSTPDTNDVSNALGGTPFYSYLLTPVDSPNGGTWIGGAEVSFRAGIGSNEAFSQTVSGLSIGQTYEISWEQANFGLLSTNPGSLATLNFPGEWNVYLDGFSTFVGGGGVIAPAASTWSSTSVQFMATSTSHQVNFLVQSAGSGSGDGTYIQMDGVGIKAVPEPSSLALFGIGCLGALMRRKRTS